MRFNLLKLFVPIAAIFISACGSGGNAGLIQIDLDKSNPERLIQFYFGSYTSASTTGPMDAGLIVEQEGQPQIIDNPRWQPT